MAKESKPGMKQPSKPVARTEVRNTPVPQVAPATAPRPSVPKTTPPPPPKAAAPATQSTSPATAPARPASKPVTHELIARRAYEIWASGQGGTDEENWTRAERELRGM